MSERAKYVRMGEVAYMREKQREAFHWIIGHPRREMTLFKARFVATWLGTPHPLRDFRRDPSFLIRSFFVSNLLAALGALAGTLLLYTDRRLRMYAVPVTAFPIVFPFAFYFSQALFRYRYPIDPIVLLLAAIAVNWLLKRAREISGGAASAPSAP
jgi:hypothetical protein